MCLDTFRRVSAANVLVDVHNWTASQRSYCSERETCTAPEKEVQKQHRLYLYQRGKSREVPLKDHQDVRSHVPRTPQQESEAELRSIEQH